MRIVSSIRLNGNITDPQYNPTLRSVLEECKRNNMTKETIDRSIKRAIAQKDNARPQLFEFVGPGRAYCLIEAVTDSPKRCLNQMNKLAMKIGIPEVMKSGQLSEFFDHRGYVCVEKSAFDEEKATEMAIEINAEEVIEGVDDDGVREVWKFLGRPLQTAQLKNQLVQRGINVTSYGTEFLPKMSVTLNERDKIALKQVMALFEEHEEVEGVHSNAS